MERKKKGKKEEETSIKLLSIKGSENPNLFLRESGLDWVGMPPQEEQAASKSGPASRSGSVISHCGERHPSSSREYSKLKFHIPNL